LDRAGVNRDVVVAGVLVVAEDVDEDTAGHGVDQVLLLRVGRFAADLWKEGRDTDRVDVEVLHVVPEVGMRLRSLQQGWVDSVSPVRPVPGLRHALALAIGMMRMPRFGSTSNEMMLPVLLAAPRTFETSSTFTSWLPTSSTRRRRWASQIE